MKVTVGQVKEALKVTESYDIINRIRNSNGDTFKQYVPMANADNIAEVGAGIQVNQTIQNDFITSLVDRIGLVVMRSVSLQNPLKKFKKGTMALGQTIEEIFTDLTKEKLYDPEEAEEKVFQREIPNVHTLFHQRNRQGFYHQTIQDDSLKTAFTSWGNFDQFIASIINAIYNSAEVDEYKYMKLLIDNYASKGQFAVEKVPEVVGEASARELVKIMRATATKMTLPFGSRDYNALAVHTRSDMSNLHLFITADLQAELDVDVLARAFNMDKTDFLGNVTIVDNFATPGLEAVMVDSDWFMVYDNNLKMETIRNPRGLYWNYYYHVWQTLSASRFANAVAFYSGDVPPVTQVILSPALTTLKQGRDLKFETYVRFNDGVEREVVYSVEGFNGADKSADTVISNEGVLTAGDNQTGELKVKATVTYTTGDGDTTEEHTVTGESIVVVTPTV